MSHSRVKNKLRDALCLISHQRVHQVDDQRLNAAFSVVLIAVFKDRVQKAFRFTGTYAGCN